MEDPFEPQDDQEPLEDPMLDAIERSIENPPGFEDPLAGPGDDYIDDVGRLLGDLEAATESPPPMLPEPIETEESELSDSPDGEFAQPDQAVPPEGVTPSEVAEDIGGVPQIPAPRESERSSSESASRTPREHPKTTRGRGTGGGRRGWPRATRRVGHGGHMTGRRSRGMRYCPESREIVDEQQCKSCEKYRRWPEGTKEEPRECWYDWEARRRGDTAHEEGEEQE